MYRVRALRGDDYSKMSNRVDVRWPEATPQTMEWAPSNLKVLVSGSVTIDEHGNIQTGDDAVQLTWDAPAEGDEWVRGYEVQRATCDGDFTSLVADTGSTATAHADAEFEEGESYTYRVRARRPQGSEPVVGRADAGRHRRDRRERVRGTHLPPVPGSGSYRRASSRRRRWRTPCWATTRRRGRARWRRMN